MDIFGKEFFAYLKTVDWWQALIMILVAIIFTIISKNFKAITGGMKSVLGLFTRNQRRTCGYCALLMLNTVSNALKQKKQITDNILDEQMKYVELKMEVLIIGFLQSYRDDQVKFRVKELAPDYILENKEYLLYREGLQNAMNLVMREIKRSFKENGFHEKSGKEFSDYVKEKSAELISITKKYMMNSYPNENMIVPLKYRFEMLDCNVILDNIFDVFTNAANIINNSESDIRMIDEEFKKSMDELANNK